MFLFGHDVTPRPSSYISKCLLDTFTLKIAMSLKGREDTVASRIQRNKATTPGPAGSAPTFLSPTSHYTNASPSHFQNKLLLSHTPVMFWKSCPQSRQAQHLGTP